MSTGHVHSSIHLNLTLPYMDELERRHFFYIFHKSAYFAREIKKTAA